MVLLALSLLVTEPVPLEMPRAEAFVAEERGTAVLEDRFSTMDLWVSQSVDGRWLDADGRVFVLAHLDVQPPEGNGVLRTRQGYRLARTSLDRRDPQALRTAIAALSSVEPSERGEPPRQKPRGLDEVGYWQGTNENVIVCAFLPERDTRDRAERVWRLAVWQLAEGDDPAAARGLFERELFERDALRRVLAWTAPAKEVPAVEAAALRADARHSVAAYSGWHVTEGEHAVVLDDLTVGSGLVASFTNDLALGRQRFAKTFPTLRLGGDVACVARIFDSQVEYLEALEAVGLTNMTWTAAYWSVARRELVAWRPEGDAGLLLRTLRHEAFHQMLSYATAMADVSPWLNEGYAQYFETEDGLPADAEFLRTPETVEQAAAAIPALLEADYEAFYSGTDEERRFRYALAQAVVCFLEQGAPEVRFRPFADLKELYFRELLQTRDMRKATHAAFRNADTLKLFLAEWIKWWKTR